MDNTENWTNIARLGDFTALSGEQVKLTPEFLDQVVASYQPEQHEAPLVFGHPQLNGPAYGWVSGVRRVGDYLQARFQQVPDAVGRLIDSGAYKKVSASFFRDNKLRHVGLLGATPPAIDGLGDIQLSAGDEYTTVEFSTEAFMDPKDEKIKELESALASEKTARAKAEADLAAATTAKDAAVQEFADFKTAQTTKDREARFDRLVEQGKAVPGEKKKVLSFATALAASDNKIEFADGKEELPEEAFWLGLEAKEGNGLLHEFATPDAAKRNGETLDTTGLTAKV